MQVVLQVTTGESNTAVQQTIVYWINLKIKLITQAQNQVTLQQNQVTPEQDHSVS